ncbi:MAG TPA: zinc-ribbon domain-containing protein [Terriglobales bacterium]|nr:zinc-ribbon domain-containing protein [Terriglobales bacterium]
MAFCATCGTQIVDNAAFCPKCGHAAATTVVATPAAAPGAPAVTANMTPAAMPMEENIAGMLAYFTIIPAIVFLVVEPFNRNRFVRFHSFQCLFTAVALVVIEVALVIVSAILHIIPVVGFMVTAILWPVWALAVLCLWILLVVKAYQHQMYKLPFVGDMAEKQAGA